MIVLLNICKPTEARHIQNWLNTSSTTKYNTSGQMTSKFTKNRIVLVFVHVFISK